MGKELIPELSFSRKDFRVDYFRGSGAGGQHRNKTDSACRITHIESKLVASCEEERSQHLNKAIAFNRLAKLVIDHYKPNVEHGRFAASKNVIRTYNEPSDLVRDDETKEKYSFKKTFGSDNMERVIEDRILIKKVG